MAGNQIGGKKTANICKRKYGKNFYKKIGALGGAAGSTGGFYNDSARARELGSIGGTKHRICTDEEFLKIGYKLDWNVDDIVHETGYKPSTVKNKMYVLRRVR